MPVDSKKVQGLRELQFSSFDEMIADAEKLVSSPDAWELAEFGSAPVRRPEPGTSGPVSMLPI
jgi:hypothetical protein